MRTSPAEVSSARQSSAMWSFIHALSPVSKASNLLFTSSRWDVPPPSPLPLCGLISGSVVGAGLARPRPGPHREGDGGEIGAHAVQGPLEGVHALVEPLLHPIHTSAQLVEPDVRDSRQYQADGHDENRGDGRAHDVH